MLDGKVRADGSDIDSWLAIVDMQEQVVEMNLTRVERTDLNLTEERSVLVQSIAEVQLSVLERASRAHPSNAANFSLLKAKLDVAVASRLWDSNRMEKEWRHAIISCSSDWPASFQLWSSFLTWKVSNGDSFAIDDVRKDFAEALDALRGILFQQDELEKKVAREKICLSLVREFVDVLLQAGYKEQANGVLQALSELNLRLPGDLAIDTEESFKRSCALLNDYWDFQEHRMGEESSTGWAAFQEKVRKDISSSIEPIAVEGVASLSVGSFPKNLQDPDPVVRWVTLERARADLRHFSAKEHDEADWTTGEMEVDPSAVVLFSDIAPFLVPIESSQGKDILVEMFLSVLGVPCTLAAGRLCHSLTQSKSIWPSHLVEGGQLSSWEIIGGEIMQREKASALSDPFRMPIKSWRPRLDEMYQVVAPEAETWFAQWESVPKDKAWMAKTYLEQIRQPSTAACLAQLGLSESAQSHKAAKKLAKVLLSQDRDNVVLWRAFARLERNNGNVDSARTVYMSLLVASHPLEELIPAWSEWAELEWEAGELNTSLLVLTIAAKHKFAKTDSSSLTALKQDAASSMENLRTRRIFEQMLTSPDCSFHIVFCAALFQYLSQDPYEAFESAMIVFGNAIDSITTREHREDIAMTHCKFIWRHIHGNARMRRSRAYISRDITATLSRYVLDFPHNSAFVSLLAAFELSTKVENVLRGVLEDKMQRSKDAASEQDWLVYLYCEMHMNQHSVNENAVRRLFERALQSKR